MPDITRSVGTGGSNDDADVTIVQRLLNAVPPGKGGPTPILDIDGWCGPVTARAISHFQAKRLGFADGLVQPGHKTIDTLNADATAPGAQDVPDPDPDPATQAIADGKLASVWGLAGLTAITGLQGHLQKTGGVAGFDFVAEMALAGHFHVGPTTPPADLAGLLATIRQNFTGALGTLSAGTAQIVYHSVSRRQMKADLGPKPDDDAPGYTPNNPKRICWTPLFHPARGPKAGYDWAGSGYGPKCRAAMVLHEPIHFVDNAADFDTYEWGPEYLGLTAERAVHNASSYPSFAAQIAEHDAQPLGPRYGAGRAND